MIRFISDFVNVDDENKTVTIYGRENRIEVEDLEAWIAGFFDALRDIEYEGPRNIMERKAFDKVT